MGKGGYNSQICGINKTAERLIELRLERGLTQKQVAQAIGANVTSYADWETGKYVSNIKVDRVPVAIKSTFVCALADFYGVSADYILGRTDYKAINGEAVAALTGLSDAAISVLMENKGCSYLSPSADASRLLEDFARNGDAGLLSAIHKYALSIPGVCMTINQNTGRPVNGGLYGIDVPIESALLYLAVSALERFRADAQSENTVSK